MRGPQCGCDARECTEQVLVVPMLLTGATAAGELRNVYELDAAGKITWFKPAAQEVIDMAKAAKKARGISPEAARSLVDMGKQVGLKCHDAMSHPTRGFGKVLHINIGPVKHIPVK